MRNEIVEIKRLGINGEGICYINRKICFVRGALPNEKCEIEITKEEKNYKEGQLVRVLEPSKSRVQPICNLQHQCLNCPLMILDDDGIKYYKKDIIRDSLRKYTHVDLRRVELRNPILSKEKVHYQNTVHLPVVKFDDEIRFGIYQRDSRFLTLMENCSLYHPLINETLQQLRKVLNDTHAEVYTDDTKTGLRFIIMRVFSDEISLVLVTGRHGLKEEIVDAISRIKAIHSIYFTINTSKDQSFAEGKWIKIYGNTNQECTFMGKRYIFSPKADFPENLSSAETLVEEVRKLISPKVKSILEIQCETGWLSLNLPEYDIKGIDSSKINIESARMNQKFNQLEHCDFEYGNILNLTEALAKAKSFDCFIVHEKHKGMHDIIKESMIKSKVKEVIYISHHPSGFAKDIADLEKYYQLKVVFPIDFETYNQSITIIAKLEWKDDKKRR